MGQISPREHIVARSDAAEHGIRSESKLFATQPSLLDTTAGIEMDFF